MDNQTIILSVFLFLILTILIIFVAVELANGKRPTPVIGGCEGTRWGCCPDGVTAKINWWGSNCSGGSINPAPLYPSRCRFGRCSNGRCKRYPYERC